RVSDPEREERPTFGTFAERHQTSASPITGREPAQDGRHLAPIVQAVRVPADAVRDPGAQAHRRDPTFLEKRAQVLAPEGDDLAAFGRVQREGGAFIGTQARHIGGGEDEGPFARGRFAGVVDTVGAGAGAVAVAAAALVAGVVARDRAFAG